MFVLSPLRPDDGPLLAQCHAAGFAGVLVEGVDNAVAGEWIAARTAQVARREALADAPKLLRLTDRAESPPVEAAFRARGVPLQVVLIQGDTTRSVYGRDPVLVRPDLHVVWRGDQPPDDPSRLVAIAAGFGEGPIHRPS